MAVARENRDRWELRLGAAQAVTWVGLALGATVGAYFVGFFSGRYVGFDTARSATVSEVAKLAIQDDFFDKQSASASSDIYSRLDGSAVSDSTNGELASAKIESANGQGTTKKGAPEPESAAARFAQEIKAREGDIGSQNQVKERSQGAVAAAEIDSLFEEEASRPSGKSGEVGAGAAAVGDLGAQAQRERDVVSAEASAAEIGVLKSAQKGVRILGEDSAGLPGANSAGLRGANSVGAELPAPPSSQSQGDTSLGAILEERVAKARTAQQETTAEAKSPTANKLAEKSADKAVEKQAAKVANVAATPTVKPTPKNVEQPAKSEVESGATTQTGMVKQVLPAGYFAQVAAPKRLTEAQDVARRLKRSGFPVVIETAHVRGEDYFRVLVGPEDTKVQAERLVDQLKRESYLSGTAFLRKVK